MYVTLDCDPMLFNILTHDNVFILLLFFILLFLVYININKCDEYYLKI